MKKILGIVVLGLLLSGNAYAGVNEPGFAPISDWQCSESFSKEHEKLRKAYLKSDKKKQVVFYTSCENRGKHSWGIKKGKNLEALHKKAYNSCLKAVKKKTPGLDCYLYSVNEEVVWIYDQAKWIAHDEAKYLEKKTKEKIELEKQAQIDKKPGRFFEDQPDVTDNYQIHFIYMLTANDKDRELDINGKIEKYADKMNKLHESFSKKTKGSSGAKKYKYDYREDGKLDISFIRLDRKRKELHKHINNNYRGWLWANGFNNPKKIYFTFADVKSRDGGEGGVGMATMFLKSKYNKKINNMIRTAVHEMHHAKGGGFNCVKGMGKNAHWSGSQDTPSKQMFFGKAYAHDIEGCPKGEDSVYLTPTSKNPYDPFKLICQNEWGKYNHPKLVKAREQQAKDLKNGNWNNRSGGSGCKFSYLDQKSGKMKIFNDQIAKSFYQGN